MSAGLKNSAFKHLPKRKISISVAQNGSSPAISTSFRESLVSSLKDQEKEITVADYLGSVNAPYALCTAVEHPIRVQVQNAPKSVIRDGILLNDMDSLRHALSEMTANKDFTLLQDLSKQEISLFLNRLIHDNIHGNKQLEQLRFPYAKSTLTPFYKKIMFQSKQISQLGRHLLVTGSLTVSDCTRILEMLNKNQQFNDASIWILQLDLLSDSNGIKFQNLKLEILGKISPSLSSKTHRHALKSKLVQGETKWNRLLDDFIKKSEDFLPNLKTHKILLSGLAKFGSLDQVEKHVDAIWGISAEHEPKSLVPKSSSLRPDNELLEILITAFASNNQLLAVFPLLNKFDKYYEFSLQKDSVWRIVLQNVDIYYPKENPEARRNIFTSVWSLMTKKNVNFSTRLYTLRLSFLREFDMVEEAVLDLGIIQERYFKQFTEAENLRLQKLMTRYLMFVVKMAYDENVDANKVVSKLIHHYTFTPQHREYLTLKAADIREQVLKTKEQFTELQKQYDQEEEEDSLW